MIEFRSAYADDFQRILDLKRQVHSAHVRHAPDFYRDTSDPLPTEEYQAMLDPNGQHRAYVLVDDGRTVAYAFVQIRELRNHPFIFDQKQLFVDDLCVDTDSRRRGYGTRIMEEMQNVAHAARCKTMELEVWDWNQEAIRFYQRRGLTFTRIRMKKELRS